MISYSYSGPEATFSLIKCRNCYKLPRFSSRSGSFAYISNLVSQLLPAQRSQQLLTFSKRHSKNSFTSLCSLSRIFLGQPLALSVHYLRSPNLRPSQNPLNAVCNYSIKKKKPKAKLWANNNTYYN